MRRICRAVTALIAVVALIVAVGACGREAAGPQAIREGADAVKFADGIRARINTDALMAHLQKLQDIADAHGGNRAAGEPGYDASVDYVAGALRDKGFDVQTPEFEVRVFKGENGTVTSGGVSLTAMPLQFTIGTPPEGLTAPLVPARPGDAPGCAATDYDGLPVSGAIVLVDRGTCPFAQKMANAVARGAVGVIIANSVDEKEMGGTLGEGTDVSVPVVSVSKADGATLRAKPEQVTIKVSAQTRKFKSRNVIAQTKTGATGNVVMVGAHLDSVPEGPGINDNGSGVAAVLETALQLGAEPDVRNAVRFGFWGAEELGLVGSARYIETLNVEELKDIALYLNFDMLASPNPGYFTYDGDQSAPRTRDAAAPRVPEGSAGIERQLVDYLASADKVAQDTSFDGRSDYDAFTLAGIPSGGLFAGAEEKMTAEQATLWDGKADEPFDPNYHKDTDTIAHIDRTALGIQGAGVGYVAAFYAQDQGGRNGMPDRADRTRHVVAPS
ncbi:M28 family metallopeptidase [Mycobacterium sp. ACS4331]|uniref:M28 family metallopeptidase n=1 Tax=Mycobacterium sp. ACS4331 TaxID=1834121 RepID=UPI0012FB9188|nr:M28 family metallopeptidase [Mycobacterium sp. ACS4331]